MSEEARWSLQTGATLNLLVSCHTTVSLATQHTMLELLTMPHWSFQTCHTGALRHAILEISNIQTHCIEALRHATLELSVIPHWSFQTCHTELSDMPHWSFQTFRHATLEPSHMPHWSFQTACIWNALKSENRECQLQMKEGLTRMRVGVAEC